MNIYLVINIFHRWQYSPPKEAFPLRIYHECDGRIEKPNPRIAVWHHRACQEMTNNDPKGRIFLSYPQTNKDFFFLLTTAFIYLFIYLL